MFDLLLITTILLTVYIYKYYENVRRYPQGPFPLPLVGNLLNFQPNRLYVYLDKCKETYGDVFTVCTPRPIVIIMNVEHARQAYRGDDVVGRMGCLPDTVFQSTENGGVTFSDGANWREQRRAAVQILRDFGMGKNQMETQVVASVEQCLRHLDSLEDKSRVDFRWPLQRDRILMVNVINNVMLNYKYPFDYCDKLMTCANRLQEVLEKLRADFRTFLVMAFPWLRFLPGQFDMQKYVDESKELNKHVLEDIRQSLDRYDEDGDPEDDQMVNVCVDFFLAGMETTSTTLRWGMLHMAANQDVQSKIRDELHSFNRTAPPSMADRPKLPYTYAAIHELQRVANIVPLNVIHRTTVETEIGGHLIPANTLNLAQIYTMHRNPAVFAEPDKFKSERFLLTDGKTPNKELLDYLNPFSMGKRQCAGEGLSRMELFLGLSAILHKYRILPPLDAPLDISPVEATILLPKTNYLQMIPAKPRCLTDLS